MADNRLYPLPLENGFEIGEKHLLRAIVRLAMQDWFSRGCYAIKDRNLADSEQSKLFNYFFDPCDDDDYGSFNYATAHISEDPEGLRETIRKYLVSGAKGLVLIGGNKFGNLANFKKAGAS